MKNQKKTIFTILKSSVLLLFLITFISCSSQDKKYIDSETIIDKSQNNSLYTSEVLDELFEIKNGTYKDIGGTNYEKYSLLEIGIVNDKKNKSILSKNMRRYLLLFDRNILRDTLKIDIGFDYSIYHDNKNDKDRIYVGKYSSQTEYFQVLQVYKISQNIKIEKYNLSIDTFCPIPNDYISDDDSNYKFGIANESKKQDAKIEANDYLLFQKELLYQFILNDINERNILSVNARSKIETVVHNYYNAKDFNTKEFHQRILKGATTNKKYVELLPIWLNSIQTLDLDDVIPHDDVPNWRYPYDEINSFKPVLLLYTDLADTDKTYSIPFYHMALYTSLVSWKKRKSFFEEIEQVKIKIKSEIIQN